MKPPGTEEHGLPEPSIEGHGLSPDGRPLPPKLSTPKKLVLALLIAFGLIAFIGLCGELGLRLYIQHRWGMPGKSLGVYQDDPEFGQVFRADSYTINTVFNHQGFRGPEDLFEPKPAGSLRIYCSGNSSTYCTNLTMDQSWPSVLQRKLRDIPGHERDQVLNAGRPGASVACEFALARRAVPRFEPDVVILHTGVNEEYAARTLASQRGYDRDALSSEGRFGLFPVEIPEPFMLRHSCRVVFVRFGDTGVTTHYLELMRTFRERGTQLAREAGATVCDVVPRFESHPQRAELAASWSGVHVTAMGAELLADALLETILQAM